MNQESLPFPPRADRRAAGQKFESVAAGYLIEHGYRIIDRNRTYPWGEIDIIAEHYATTHAGQKALTLVFVEVRSRSVEEEWFCIEESIQPKKANRLRRAIETYLLFYKGPAAQVRIDLMAVRGYSDQIHIDHYENYISLERQPRSGWGHW